MSTEENVHLDSTLDEQFRFVKQGRYSDMWQTERGSIKTVLSLLGWMVAFITFHNIAHSIRDSHEVREIATYASFATFVPYLAAGFIVLAILMVMVLLAILVDCAHLWYQGNLHPRAILFILGALTLLVSFTAAGVASVLWYYSL